MRKDLVVYVSIGRPDSELFSNSMKVSRGGIIMKSHCCDADTYNRKVGLFLRNARVLYYAKHCKPAVRMARWAARVTARNHHSNVTLSFVLN